MAVVTCFYHPELQAIDKCERCLRPICLNDKISERHGTSSGTGEHQVTRYYKVITCPLCKLNIQIYGRENSPVLFLGVLGFILAGFFVIGNFAIFLC